MNLSEKRSSPGKFLDYFIITFFSAFICTYTANIMKMNMEARVRAPLADTTLAWLLQSPGVCVGICLLFCALWMLGWAFLNSHDTLFAFLYRKKVLLTILFVGFWLLFDLNSSSLYYWTYYLNGANDQAPLWGIAQPFRSDEWAIWTPLVFAQQYEGYPAVSSLISGGGIDTRWISVGGIPAWNTVLLFKPLYWPFLLFGLETGLSFLSVSRFVLLFWVSYAFAQVYTKQNRILSLTAAMALTFSPYIQWWYSQSIAEVFIYAQGMLLAVHHYLKAEKAGRRFLCAGIFSYLLGCYIMIAYPGWLICVFYLVLVLSIWAVCHNRKTLAPRRDLPALIPVLITVGLLLYSAFLSKDTLTAVSGSVYPGSRLHTGGSVSWDFYTGLFSVLFPLEYCASFSNVCDSSNFLSFSPAGLVLAVCAMVKQKKRDPVTLVLMGLEAFLAAFMLLGVSPTFAKITLLSQCTRLQPVIALIDMILLYKHLAGGHIRLPAAAVILLTIASGLLIWLPGAGRFTYSRRLTLLVFILGCLIFFLIYSRDPQKPRTTRRMCYAIICCAVLAGGFVNPIQRGISCVTELEIVQKLSAVEDAENDLYLMEGYFPTTNLPLLAGKRCYNSTTVYPDLEKWEVLDPEGTYRDIYNRFCHVNISMCREDTSFELAADDQIKINLSFSDLRKLNIDWLITREDYTNEIFDGMRLVLEDRTEQLNIYRIIYE